VHDVLHGAFPRESVPIAGPGHARAAGTEPRAPSRISAISLVDVVVKQAGRRARTISAGVFTISQEALGFTVVSVVVCPAAEADLDLRGPVGGAASRASRSSTT